MYEKFLDNPEEMAAIKREEDPFWEPIEDILIGTANVFLQNLSFALDFDDIVAVRDYKVIDLIFVMYNGKVVPL